MSGNGYLKGMDLALALRAGAGHMHNAAAGARDYQLAFSIFCEFAYMLDTVAESLERQYARPEQPDRVVRSEKAAGDVVIGSVCEHEWLINPTGDKEHVCKKCGERHFPDCPSLTGAGPCSCREESKAP